MDAKGVTAVLRSDLWPWLRERGFTSRTDRVAWRYDGGTVDVVEVQLVGSLADSVGSTTYSYSAYVGSLPAYLPRSSVPTDPSGRPRPHYWHCQLQAPLAKTLRQPWFRPFSTPPSPRLPGSFAKHRAGLMSVIRRDTHDRADIWFVLEDGSNVEADIDDLIAVLERHGLPLLARFRDPCALPGLLDATAITIRADSPAGRDLIAAAANACAEGAS
jgi:hypothetical protein